MKTLLTLVVLLFSSSIIAECISGDCSNGYGTYIFADGEFERGIFENGELIEEN